ncbi:MAG TPA: HU family DNA-binding protein [Atribacteraceae bacterium]|nr:HU family DNA-binding protein [Atribacteraceae bacterium]
MNKRDLVDAVAEELKKNGMEITKKDTAMVIDILFDIVQEELKKEDGKIQLVGFGTFGVKTRAGRRGRNPQTGKEVQIPASRVPFFRPGKVLKEMVK